MLGGAEGAHQRREWRRTEAAAVRCVRRGRELRVELSLGFWGDRKKRELGLYRASTWARGRLGITIPGRSEPRRRSGVLRSGIAWARGKREGGPRGSVRGRERGANGRPRARGFGHRALGQAGSGVGGLRLARWWAALGAGWAGWPGWRLGLFF